MRTLLLNQSSFHLQRPRKKVQFGRHYPYVSPTYPITFYKDQIILARITIDERPLRRIIKRFHNYTSLSHTPIVPVLPGSVPTPASVEDAREGFLVELAQFQLLMKKSAMICEAEARQVEEYQRERQALGAFTFISSTLEVNVYTPKRRRAWNSQIANWRA